MKNSFSHQVQSKVLITEVLNRIMLHADLGQWDKLKKVFADDVTLDYTSEFRAEPIHITPDKLVEEWKWLANYEGSEHIIAGHVIDVEGDTATATAQELGVHKYTNPDGEPFWDNGGHYEFKLKEVEEGVWKVTFMKYVLRWERGNKNIVELVRGKALPNT
nr:nuclear transport factor 2 family protein [Allomuricauda sp.]